ncbi:adenylate/guanylate cyclase catalytic domain protein [Ancylostoma caninum]|uniref:guanylate cyclase n=1 Tax=Ancylostoma caninum TaxID=29170 RepID=A0A368FH42_ANCCA|nr:adenylate/guanylate cyclase catalytic domain protein [Ancylostoma caninum]
MMAAVALCIGMFVSFRKIKHIESMQMPWAIAYPTLKFIDLDISTHGSQQLSILSLNEHMETKVKMRDFLRTRQLATINQSYVLVETISLKERLVFFKQDVDLLLKISGFGLSRMLFRMKNSGVIGTEDGHPFIPNTDLHYYAPEIRNELRAHMFSNKFETIHLTTAIGKAADMWSFGTILFEILFRRKYVEVEDYYDSAGEDDVLICEKADDVLLANPPVVPEDREIHADLRGLIQKCWDNVDNRPDISRARKITDATLKMSGSLVDQMIKNMEEYTNGLEELVKRRTGLLEEAQKKADELLSELLPKSVAEELKVGRRVDAKNYKSASILYSDIVGFTSLCSESEPMEVVALLSGMFQKFDHIISVHNGYKMETIGDAYCVASGVPNPSKTEHVSNIATIALLQREFLYDFMIPHRPGQYLHCRWGFNTGPVFTGVVGIRAPRYSVFGPTVTIAAKMENSGIPDKIQMTLKSHQMLSARFPEFKCSSRGSVKIDGIGTLLTYWLDGVEDLLKSDRTPHEKELPAAASTSDEDPDPYTFPRETSQVSSANSVVPLIP